MFKRVLFTFAVLVGFWCAQIGAAQIVLNTSAAQNAEYLWVYNSDNVAHEVGDVVIYYDGTLADGVEISTTTSASSTLVAGIVAQNDIAATSWGMIQVSGYHSGITVGVATSAGSLLGTSTTGEATGITSTLGAVVAVALEATTSSTTVKGFIYRR